MAGITTPFTTPAFPFLQTVSQRALDSMYTGVRVGRTVRARHRLRRRGTAAWARASSRSTPPRLRLRAAMERRRCSANIGAEPQSLEVPAMGVEDRACRHARRECEPADGRTTCAGPPLLDRVPTHSSAGLRGLRRSAIPRSRSLSSEPYPQFTTVSLYRNNVGIHHRTRVSRSVYLDDASRAAWPTRSRTRGPGSIDNASSVFDASLRLTGPARELPDRGQPQSRARARLLDGRYPARARHRL